ncbi:MAG: hypothetical protein Barrevirus12_19 [Barrevirus sp.]|uniref:Uncharacterized protein n=1 Tax=Barrevirus sp. TaxID=2487763 RepID=A0A3G4ZQD2_9VIRU|nr:MAG: hypothetical protein Barrevirus12_19 [Barrevirus sp.]
MKGSVYKHTIVFIHGNKKDKSDFSITDNNKEIGIETELSKTCNTVLIQIEIDDYMKPIKEGSK